MQCHHIWAACKLTLKITPNFKAIALIRRHERMRSLNTWFYTAIVDNWVNRLSEITPMRGRPSTKAFKWISSSATIEVLPHRSLHCLDMLHTYVRRASGWARSCGCGVSFCFPDFRVNVGIKDMGLLLIFNSKSRSSLG